MNRRSEWNFWAMVVVSITGFVAAAAFFVSRQTPFSGDEPLYGLRSRSFRWGESPWFVWPSYRAPGLPLLAAPFVDMPEPLLRTFVFLLGAGSVAAVYFVGKPFIGRNGAAWAAVIYAATPGLLASSVYFFPDVPGMFFVLVAVWSLVRYLLGRGPHRWLVLMCASLIVAGVVRFSVGIVALAALVALLVAAPDILSVSRIRALVTGALLVAITAGGTFGPSVGALDGLSPWAANRELLGQNAAPLSRRFVTLADASSLAFGFSRHMSWGAIAGAVFLVVCGTGLLLGLRDALRSRYRLSLFPITWFCLTLGFYLIALDHFEVRYLVPVLAPVAMVSGAGLSAAAQRVPRMWWSAALVTITLGAGLLFGSYLIAVQLRADDAEDLAVRSTGDFVAAADGECVITMADEGPKVWLLPWYSGCHASHDSAAPTYIAVWRDASTPAVSRTDAELVHSEAFSLTKQGHTERLVIDLYRVRDPSSGLRR